MPRPKPKKSIPATPAVTKPVFIRVPQAAREALESLCQRTKRHLQAELAFALHDYLQASPVIAEVPDSLGTAVHGKTPLRAILPVATWDELTRRADRAGRDYGVEVGLAIFLHAKHGPRPMPEGILM